MLGWNSLVEKLAPVLSNPLLAAAFIPLFLAFGVIAHWAIGNALKEKGEEYAEGWKRTKNRFFLFFIFLGTYCATTILAKHFKIWAEIATVLSAVFLTSKIGDEVAFVFFERIAKRTKTKLDDLLLPLVKNVWHIALLILAICFVMSRLGYDVTALVAGLSVTGLAVAFASKQVLENFFGGVVILLDRLFDVGQVIEVKGVRGKVKGIGLRSTILVREDTGNEVVIPNSLIITNIVERVKQGKKK